MIFAYSPALAQTGDPIRDLPPNDPNRQIIERILNSSDYQLQWMFTNKQWISGRYGDAWERSKQYLDNGNMVLNPDGTYFMTHGFTGDGKLFMEVYNGWNLQTARDNLNYNDDDVVGHYNNIIGSGNADNIRSINQKLGDLAPYFNDEASKEKLKEYLGDKLYNALLKTLREEGYHMFGGAFMHEGMHALMDDSEPVKKIQDDYASCNLGVQWDELRGYMVELNYHSRSYRWNTQIMNNYWTNIYTLLRQLEAFRNKQKPISEKDKEKIEKIKAKIKAYIAMMRTKMREIRQSLDRMEQLMDYFTATYTKPGREPQTDRMLASLSISISNFARDVNTLLNRMENWLQGIESYMRHWNQWADCNEDDPPPRDSVKVIQDTLKRIKYPRAPVKEIDKVKDHANDKIRRKYGSKPIPRRNSIQFQIGAGINNTNMSGLNTYFDYLGDRWNGDLDNINNELSYFGSATWLFHWNLGIGIQYEYMDARKETTFLLTDSEYSSKHELHLVMPHFRVMAPVANDRLRFFAQFAPGYGSAKYQEIEDQFVLKGNDSGFVWETSGGVNIMFNDDMGMSFTGGYRSASFDEFDATFFSPGNPPVELDFSGPFGKVGLTVEF